MAIRAVVIALVLFVAYNCLLEVPFLREQFWPQSPWQANIVRAQDFMLRREPSRCVIVGSSLSARIIPEEIGLGVENIAFFGGGPITGLELVTRRAAPVGMVLIETNYIYKPCDETLLANVLHPAFAALRERAPALQERHQPVGVLTGCLRPLLQEEPGTAGSGDRNKSVFVKWLGINQSRFGVTIENALCTQQLDSVEQSIRALEHKGVEVVFLEMPVDQSLVLSPLAVQMRQAVRQRFPQIRWIAPEAGQAYGTTDGVHLTPTATRLFSRRIRAVVDGQRSTVGGVRTDSR